MGTREDHRMRSFGLAVAAVLLAAGIAAAEPGVVGKFDSTTGAGEVKLSSGVREFSCAVSKPPVSLRVNQRVEVDVKSETLQLSGGHEKCRLVAQRPQPPQEAQPPQAALCAVNPPQTPGCLAMPGLTPGQPPGPPVPAVAVGQTCYLPGVGNPGYPGQCAALQQTACPLGAGYKFDVVGCCMSALANPTSGPVYALVTCKRVQ